ncbi:MULTISPECIES: hypothetical protein [unclassified Crossiella]|uniref:hypothetical protein n=1 Tax=Crossiella sp. CA-258035 TaxID=2981138 RepID=UPI0024BCD50E|nr:hypothetical protein [Crossiella sp. CA-258035]WHT16013.1 hypothetical protein N8J89_23060 [Crossiella sp. CA-258035]
MRLRALVVAAFVGLTTLVAGVSANAAPIPDTVISDQFQVRAQGVSAATICTIQLRAQWPSDTQNVRISFQGRTNCGLPVIMTGQATLYSETRQVEQAGPRFGFAYLYQGVSSATHSPVTRGAEQILGYTTTLIAPQGQVWRQAPRQCTGLNTPVLNCSFDRTFLV